jgi:protocatechuate 3,4-dioxygenase beta subunit
MRLVPILLFSAATLQASISGTLIDEQGKPIAGATVRAYASEDWKTASRRLMSGATDRPVVATSQSGENGAFKLDPKTLLVEVVIEANGMRARAFEAPDGEELNFIVMRAGKPRTLHLVSGNKAVANAIVAAGPLAARSDGEGTVIYPEASSRVFIVHPDFAPMTDFSSIEQTKEIALSPGVAVKGRVLAEDGQPVANATVSVAGWPMAQSAADGTFAIAHAPSNWHTLKASDATRAATVTNTRASSYDIKLQPTGTISGTTTPGSRVFFESGMQETDGLDSVIADAQGKFSAVLPAHSYVVRAARSGYQSARADVILQKGQTVTRTLTLKPMSIARGRVIDEEKKPVEGAFVSAGLSGFLGNRQLVRTAASGDFVVRYSAELPNARAVAVAVKAGYAAGAAAIPNSTAPLTITLPRGLPLEVRIVDKQGKRVPNATMSFAMGDEDGFGFRVDAVCEQPLVASCHTTDDSGALHLRVIPGNYMAAVRGESIVSRMQLRENVTATSSPLTVEVERGVDVTGRVAYSDRSPVPDAIVTTRTFAVSASARTDADGFFTLHNVLPGKITINASDASRIEGTPVDVEAPARGVAITIPNPARVEGRVVDRETNAPVSDFQIGVVARRGNSSSSSGSPANIHSDDGSYVVDRVAPQTLDLMVTAPGYARGSLTGLTPEEGKTLRAPDIQLDKGGSIRGRVTANQQPVSGVRLRVGENRFPGMSAPFGNTTDENGEFFIDSLAPGEQSVVFERQGFVAKRKTVEVAKGKEARLDVELDRGEQLQGRVVDKSGAPISGARVMARGTGPMGSRPATTDASGSFTLEALSEGRYTVQASKEGFVEAVSPEIAVPATAPLTLTLDPGATLTGRVIGLSAAELVAVEVTAGGRGANARTSVNSDGTFTLHGVPDGRVTVNAFLRSSRMRQAVPQTVEVTNGAGPSVQIDFAEGLSVTGRVTRSGAPFTDGNVNFSGKVNRNSPISGDGTYQVDALVPGDYRVSVYAPGGSLFQGNYTVSANGSFDIQIEGATVRGRVVDAATGAPVSDVVVMTVGTRTNPSVRQARTDSAGQFTLESLPAGSVEVRASPRQKYAMQSQTITVTNGGASDLEFRLETVQPTVFRVTDAATGAPLDAMISVMNGKASVGSSSGPRDEDGRVRVFLPAGSYTARVWARGYSNQNVNFSTPGAEVRVALQAAGKLVIVASKPTRVRLMPEGTGTAGFIAGPAGFMATAAGAPFENLNPGTYRIEVLGDDNKTVLRSVPVTVISGQTSTVRVD